MGCPTFLYTHNSAILFAADTISNTCTCTCIYISACLYLAAGSCTSCMHSHTVRVHVYNHVSLLPFCSLYAVPKSDVCTDPHSLSHAESCTAIWGTSHAHIFPSPTAPCGPPTIWLRGSQYTNWLWILWQCTKHAPHIWACTFTSQ